MTQRKIKTVVGTVIMIGLLSLGISVFAQQVNPKRHPNLAAAQESIQSALDRLSAAQQANEFDLKGHALKAKQLLTEAYAEIGLAARAANGN